MSLAGPQLFLLSSRLSIKRRFPVSSQARPGHPSPLSNTMEHRHGFQAPVLPPPARHSGIAHLSMQLALTCRPTARLQGRKSEKPCTWRHRSSPDDWKQPTASSSWLSIPVKGPPDGALLDSRADGFAVQSFSSVFSSCWVRRQSTLGVLGCGRPCSYRIGGACHGSCSTPPTSSA